MILWLLKAGKAKILAATAMLVALVAFADWAVGRNVSLAALYILPTMLGAVVLPAWGTVALAILCAYLRSLFDVPGSPAELVLRFVFAVAAYVASGQFVTLLIRGHEQ